MENLSREFLNKQMYNKRNLESGYSFATRSFGKLVLSGEYLVLDGALSLGLPVKYGQELKVYENKSFNPKLTWKSYTMEGECWFDTSFEFWHFNNLNNNESEEVRTLQKILRSVRRLNPHFLRDEVDVLVETKLDFPVDWGLGSSSTLINNIADWAKVSPFKLLFNSIGGSGLDVACAQTLLPILYSNKDQNPTWKTVDINPLLLEQMYFVHLGVKQNTKSSVERYRNVYPQVHSDHIDRISELSTRFTTIKKYEELNQLIKEYESVMSTILKLVPVKEEKFDNYWGEVRSLGAWGGDFVMASSDRSPAETKEYFKLKGYETCIPAQELLLLHSNIRELQ